MQVDFHKRISTTDWTSTFQETEESQLYVGTVDYPYYLKGGNYDIIEKIDSRSCASTMVQQ